MTQVKRSKEIFEPDHRFHKPEYVAKVFWSSVRKALEYQRAARIHGENTTIHELIEMRQRELE